MNKPITAGKGGENEKNNTGITRQREGLSANFETKKQRMSMSRRLSAGERKSV